MVVGDGTAGQILTSDGDGSMSWATGVTGDITSIIATDGLTTPDGTAGDVTIGLAAGVAGDGLTLTTGVLSVDYGTTAGTSLEGDTDLLQLGTSGTTALAGDTALLQLGTSGTTALAGDTALLQLGTSGTTALAGDTALLALGTSGTTALAGDTALLQVGTLVTEALAGNTTTITPDQASDITDNNDKVSNVTHTGDVTGDGLLTLVDNKVITSKILDLNVTTDKIADDAVNYNKLADEFTLSTPISASAVDFSSASVFTKTLSGTTTLTFSGVLTGMVKTLVISGNHSLVMTGVTILNGTYSGTATKNIIQIVSTNGSTEMFATVSNV